MCARTQALENRGGGQKGVMCSSGPAVKESLLLSWKPGVGEFSGYFLLTLLTALRRGQRPGMGSERGLIILLSRSSLKKYGVSGVPIVA